MFGSLSIECTICNTVEQLPEICVPEIWNSIIKDTDFKCMVICKSHETKFVGNCLFAFSSIGLTNSLLWYHVLMSRTKFYCSMVIWCWIVINSFFLTCHLLCIQWLFRSLITINVLENCVAVPFCNKWNDKSSS